jgi:hypothetical protein
MNKIDFFGGLHGNFLEFIINTFVFEQKYNLSEKLFTGTGACHNKNNNKDYMKSRQIVANHYSYNNIPFGSDDKVIRIVCENNNMLIAITNSFLRAGDQEFDLDNLEIGTVAKLKNMPKAQFFLATLVDNFGHQENYNRSALRNYFYSMFADPVLGLDNFIHFNPAECIYNFPFTAFFDMGQFYKELNQIGKFLNFNFYPTIELGKIHEEFISLNQGYTSDTKCRQILANVLNNIDQAITLNIIEEAWLNWQIAEIFRCYDLPLLLENNYPTSTSEISNAIYTWKSNDYLTPNQ